MIKTFSTGLPVLFLYLGNPSLAAMAYLGGIFEEQVLKGDDVCPLNKSMLFATSPLFFSGLCAITFMMPAIPLIYLFTFSTGAYLSFVEDEAINNRFGYRNRY